MVKPLGEGLILVILLLCFALACGASDFQSTFVHTLPRGECSGAYGVESNSGEQETRCIEVHHCEDTSTGTHAGYVIFRQLAPMGDATDFKANGVRGNWDTDSDYCNTLFEAPVVAPDTPLVRWCLEMSGMGGVINAGPVRCSGIAPASGEVSFSGAECGIGSASDNVVCSSPWLPDEPEQDPTQAPTLSPTPFPTSSPSESPSELPSSGPTSFPTSLPSHAPSLFPTSGPTSFPTSLPSHAPSLSPTSGPTSFPTTSPSHTPSLSPTSGPTSFPTSSPSRAPSLSPTSSSPSRAPSLGPTRVPGGSVPVSERATQPATTPLPREEETTSAGSESKSGVAGASAYFIAPAVVAALVGVGLWLKHRRSSKKPLGGGGVVLDRSDLQFTNPQYEPAALVEIQPTQSGENEYVYSVSAVDASAYDEAEGEEMYEPVDLHYAIPESGSPVYDMATEVFSEVDEQGYLIPSEAIADADDVENFDV